MRPPVNEEAGGERGRALVWEWAGRCGTGGAPGAGGGSAEGGRGSATPGAGGRAPGVSGRRSRRRRASASGSAIGFRAEGRRRRASGWARGAGTSPRQDRVTPSPRGVAARSVGRDEGRHDDEACRLAQASPVAPGEGAGGRRAGWCRERAGARSRVRASPGAALKRRDRARPSGSRLRHGRRRARSRARAGALRRCWPRGAAKRDLDLVSALGQAQPGDGGRGRPQGRQGVALLAAGGHEGEQERGASGRAGDGRLTG